MRLLSLLALIVAVSANSIRIPESGWLQSKVPQKHITDNHFKSGREYQFFYNGQLATGIPGSSQQHSATRIQALISLVFQSDNECLMKMVHYRFGKLNDRLSEPRNIQPFSMYHQIDVNDGLKSYLSYPVKFTYRNGMIDNIVFDGSEQPWSANIKRGVLNMLQVNLNKERQINRHSDDLRSQNQQDGQQYYTTMERSIEGECPTMYTVTSEPCRQTSLRHCRDTGVPVLNVTKSIDFQNCDKRPDIRYNERFEQICPTCDKQYTQHERMLRSSTVGRYNLVCSSGDRRSCLVERSEIESQYNFVVIDKQSNMISTYVSQYLELVKTGDIETSIQEPNQPTQSDSQMIYTPDWDVYKEQFFMDGQQDFHQKTPYSDLKDKVQFVKSILTRLVHFMRESVQEEAPRQFARLVRVMRMLKSDELKSCHDKFFKNTPNDFTREEHKKIKNLMVDAVALCGTRDCINHLVHTIEQGHVNTVKGAMAIKKLTDVRVISKDMIERVWSICSSGKCDSSPVLKQSVYLTCGSLMRGLCVDTRDKLAIQFKQGGRTLRQQQCPDDVKEQFISRITSKLCSSSSKYDRILCIKTLSNAGLDTSIHTLQKIIYNTDKQYSTIERTEAILACRQLSDQIPRKVISVLMPIYMNRRLDSQLRIAAFYQLMMCQPSKPVLDQLTRSLRTEPQMQVVSFTYTLMQTMANSTNPCEKRMSDDLKLSMRLGRHVSMRQWWGNSKMYRWTDKCSHNKKFCYSIDVASSYSNMSSVPKAIGTSFNLNGGGMWSPRLLTFGFTQQGLDSIFYKFLRGQSHNLQSSLSDLLSGKYDLPSPRFNYRQELKGLWDQLNIEGRQQQYSDDNPNTHPFGTIYMKFKNQEYGFIPLTGDIVPEEIRELLSSGDDSTINKIVKHAQRYMKDVNVPFDIQTGTFLHEQSRKIPTTLGLPLVMSVKIPTVMQASGMVKIDTDSNNPLGKFKLVFTDFKPSVVSTIVTKVECWFPIVNTGLKVLVQGKVSLPFDGSLSINTLKNPSEYSFSWTPKFTRQHELVVLQTRPITTTLVWPKFLQTWKEPEEKTVYGSEWTRVNQHNVEFGEHSVGVKFHSRGSWHHTPQHRVPTTPVCPLSGPNKYVLTMQPGYEMPNEIKVKLTGRLFNSLDKKAVNVDFGKFYDDSSEDFLSHESSEEQDSDGSGNNYKYSGQRPVQNKFQVDIFTRGSSVERKCKLETQCMCGDQMKTCKCKFYIERTPVPTIENSKWKCKFDLEMLYPSTPFTMSDLTSDKKFMCRLTGKWGQESNMNGRCDIKIVGEQSQLMQYLKDRSVYKRLYDNDGHRQNHRSLFSPVGQYKHTQRYGLLDEIKIDVDYQMGTTQMQWFNQLYRYLKNKYYGQTLVRNVGINNPQDRLRIKLNIDPVNRRYCNVTVMSPREQCYMKDIPLFTDVSGLNMRRLSTPSRSFGQWLSQTLKHSGYPQCEIRTDRIKTFDQVKYYVPTSTCYSVLAKDCGYSGQSSKFAVLIKKQSSSTEKKTLKIVTPKVKLVVRGVDQGKIECELNGEQKSCGSLYGITEHGNHVVLRCQQYGDKYLGCYLPEAGLRVYFDGYSANIKVSSWYRGQVCGLCGHYNQEQDDDLMSARRQTVSTRGMFDSYLVRDGDNSQCEHQWNDDQQYTQLSWDTYYPDTYDYDYNGYQWGDQYQGGPSNYYGQGGYNGQDGSYYGYGKQDSYYQGQDTWSSLPSELQSSPVYSRDQSIQPVQYTKVIEQSDEICFSKQPVKQCPYNTYAVDYKQQQQKVVYCCLPRSDIRSETYQRRAQQHRVVDEVESLSGSFTETEIVPKTCRYY